MSERNQILSAISAMRDSVWVINSEIQKEPITKEAVQTVLRNVQHLEYMMTNDEITSAGEDLTDVTEAIAIGNTFVQNNKNLLEE